MMDCCLSLCAITSHGAVFAHLRKVASLALAWITICLAVFPLNPHEMGSAGLSSEGM